MVRILISIVQLTLLILSITCAWFYAEQLRSLRSGAPFISSKNRVVQLMIKMAALQHGERVYDLGSGNGQIAIAASARGARAIGIELNRFAIAISRISNRLQHQSATFINSSFFDVPLRDANVIFLYLLPDLMKKLEPKLKKELKPGTRIISNAFPLSIWPAKKVESGVYRYIVPTKE